MKSRQQRVCDSSHAYTWRDEFARPAHQSAWDTTETPTGAETNAICLMCEFPELDSAQVAAASLRRRADHVEGPVSYSA